MKFDAERFGGIARLYGAEAAGCFSRAKVAVVGIGGVGSWAAEALARSGVGTIILMDLDDLCITNTNRQIHALNSTIGQLKVEVMAERLRDINPSLVMLPLPMFYSSRNAEHLFELQPDVVVDAIDSMKAKAHLIATCYGRGVPLVTCGGAGGRRRVEDIRMADLAHTSHDALLVRLRKVLRQEYDLPLADRAKALGIPCVYSTEKPVFPQCDGGVGFEREEGQLGGISCSAGMGSATHITGTFGFFAASAALRFLSTTTPHEV